MARAPAAPVSAWWPRPVVVAANALNRIYGIDTDVRQLRVAAAAARRQPLEDHKVAYTRDRLLAELTAAAFAPRAPFMPVVYDTPPFMDVLARLALGPYARLVCWKRAAAMRHPEESTGFCVVAPPQRQAS